MNLLSSILPGVREFRTPFVAGAIWLAVFAVVGFARYQGELPGFDSVAAVRAILRPLPGTVDLAVLATLCFIVGSVAVAISEFLESHPKRDLAISKIGHALGETKRPSGRNWLSRRRAKFIGWASKQAEVPSAASRYMVTDAVHAHLPRLPMYVREEVAQMVRDELDLAVKDLSFRSPEQYQNYDRLRAEYELRNAMWLPLLVLTISLAFLTPAPYSLLLVLAGAFVAIALKLQAIARRRKANEFIAQSIYTRWATPPVLQAIIERSQTLESANRHDQWDHVAAVIELMLQRAWDDRARRLFERLRAENYSIYNGAIPSGLIDTLSPWTRIRIQEYWGGYLDSVVNPWAGHPGDPGDPVDPGYPGDPGDPDDPGASPDEVRR